MKNEEEIKLLEQQTVYLRQIAKYVHSIYFLVIASILIPLLQVILTFISE